jgi:hypothetical protein
LEGPDAEKHNNGIELLDLSSNNFKTNYNILTPEERKADIRLMSVDVKHSNDNADRYVYALKDCEKNGDESAWVEIKHLYMGEEGVKIAKEFRAQKR